MKVCNNCNKIVKIYYYIFLEKSVAKYCRQCHNAYKLQEQKQNEMEAEPKPVDIQLSGIKRSYDYIQMPNYGFMTLTELMADDIIKYENF